jgi:spore coat protein CotF
MVRYVPHNDLYMFFGRRQPLFNDLQVVATRLAYYKTNIPQIKRYLQDQTKNLIEVDASASKWKMWYTALEVIENRNSLTQDYVERREKREYLSWLPSLRPFSSKKRR